MQQDHESAARTAEPSQESFLGSFTRVPNGLDPTQVYSYFLKVQARQRQLEEQARQASAPFILEAALREAAESRAQAARAAERTYDEIVRTGEQEAERTRAEARAEAERVRAEAQQEAQTLVCQARTSAAAASQEAEQIRAQAHEEASRIRRQAIERNEQDEQELERLCVDFANLLQRLLDRRKAVADEVESAAPSAPPRDRTAPIPFGDRSASADAAPLIPAEPPRPTSLPTVIPFAPAASPPPPAAPATVAAAPTPITPPPVTHREDEHEEERPAEPRTNLSAADAWPDDWSFAVPGSTAAEQPAAPAEQSAREPQDGQRGFRLPSWLDM